MHNHDFKVTSSAVILAALLLAATDTKAHNPSKRPDSQPETGAKKTYASIPLPKR